MSRLSQDVSKYHIWYVKDENGHESHHYAETSERAIQAHLTHWGKAGLRTEPKAVSIQSFKGVVCSERECIDTANIPEFARRQIFGG